MENELAYSGLTHGESTAKKREAHVEYRLPEAVRLYSSAIHEQCIFANQ